MLVSGELRGEVGRKGGWLGGSREVDLFNVSYVRILGLESASCISHSDEVGGRRNVTRMRWGSIHTTMGALYDFNALRYKSWTKSKGQQYHIDSVSALRAEVPGGIRGENNGFTFSDSRRSRERSRSVERASLITMRYCSQRSSGRCVNYERKFEKCITSSETVGAT